MAGIALVAALGLGAAWAGPAQAQSTGKAGPTDASGRTAPAGTAVAPLPPPDASTGGTKAGVVSGTPATPVAQPDGSTRPQPPPK